MITMAGFMEEAVLKDLAELPLGVRSGGVAAVALLAARKVDEGGMAPRDEAAFLARVQIALVQLREQSTGEVHGDRTDEVREKREQRMAGGAPGGP
jgi:hypothetical protein